MVFALLSTLLLALSFSANKLYQSLTAADNANALRFSAMLGTILAVMFLALNGFSLKITAFSLLMSFLSTMLVLSYTIIGFKIMEKEKVALYTVFLMSGGMVLPYIWGLIFLGEKFSVLRTLGLLLIIFSMVVSNRSTEKQSKRATLMCIAVFVLNGFVSIVSKEHQIGKNAVGTVDFSVMSNAIKALACFLILPIFKTEPSKKTEKPEHNLAKQSPIKLILIVFLSAVSSGAASLLLLHCAKYMPATVLYPVNTGGTVLLTAIFGRIFFKEKITKQLGIGLALCFLGTCAFV